MARDPSLPQFSFTKQERLRSPGDFKRVCSGGRRLKTKNFIIYALPNALGLPRLGLTVSAKMANSPGRSRIKRLLREFFRLNKTCFIKQAPHNEPQETRGHVGQNRDQTGPEKPNPPCEIKSISDKEKTPSHASAGCIIPAKDDMSGFRTGTLDVVISLKNPAATFGFKEIGEELTGALSRMNRPA